MQAYGRRVGVVVGEVENVGVTAVLCLDDVDAVVQGVETFGLAFGFDVSLVAEALDADAHGVLVADAIGEDRNLLALLEVDTRGVLVEVVGVARLHTLLNCFAALVALEGADAELRAIVRVADIAGQLACEGVGAEGDVGIRDARFQFAAESIGEERVGGLLGFVELHLCAADEIVLARVHGKAYAVYLVRAVLAKFYAGGLFGEAEILLVGHLHPSGGRIGRAVFHGDFAEATVAAVRAGDVGQVVNVGRVDEGVGEGDGEFRRTAVPDGVVVRAVVAVVGLGNALVGGVLLAGLRALHGNLGVALDRVDGCVAALLKGQRLSGAVCHSHEDFARARLGAIPIVSLDFPTARFAFADSKPRRLSFRPLRCEGVGGRGGE